mgnify:CR=1 FL=1
MLKLAVAQSSPHMLKKQEIARDYLKNLGDWAKSRKNRQGSKSPMLSLPSAMGSLYGQAVL